ncbi:MAG TPA: hypothetical protein VFU05_12770 [Cyclobacteriaceae bacterium]|nr:hypothetical protein [Cyclobacteriaceae bacterium]
MKKLEDIPKKHPFKVPEGYFDKLPGIIQARIVDKSEVQEAKSYFRHALQYALPVIALAIVVVIYFIPKNTQDVDTILASVSTEELVAYLENSEITTEELLEEMTLDTESVEAIESEVYFNFNELENLDELDLDNL